MKLPRWLVICLLGWSVLAVLATAGSWWVTWPERTAREFAELMAAGKRQEAREMIYMQIPWHPSSAFAFRSKEPADWNPAGLVAEPQTFNELISARRSFRLLTGRTLLVERGKVIHMG